MRLHANSKGVVLQKEIAEDYLCETCVEWVDLYCDARSSPPRVAAVLIDAQNNVSFSDWEPDAKLLGIYTVDNAGDKNIMNLELLAIMFGLSTFLGKLRGTSVRIWTDNVGAEGALRKGASAKSSANMAVHNMWLLATRSHTNIWIGRVPTKVNIADGPSREEYSFLNALGATWKRPHIDASFYQPGGWRHFAFCNTSL